MSANKATGVGTELPIYNTLVTQTPLSKKVVMKPYDGRSIKNADYAVKLERNVSNGSHKIMSLIKNVARVHRAEVNLGVIIV